MVRIGTFLIAIALIAGMVGCGGDGGDGGNAEHYNLTISSTSGGSVIMLGEGTFVVSAGLVVSLVATPTTGYHFVNWTGDVDTIANVNAALTTITPNGNYSITANFEAIPAGQYSLTISYSGCGWVETPGRGLSPMTREL